MLLSLYPSPYFIQTETKTGFFSKPPIFELHNFGTKEGNYTKPVKWLCALRLRQNLLLSFFPAFASACMQVREDLSFRLLKGKFMDLVLHSDRFVIRWEADVLNQTRKNSTFRGKKQTYFTFSGLPRSKRKCYLL